jgi:drug/metabolite transporter (DMT)-like permease
MSHYIAAALVIFLMGFGQVFLKLGTTKKKDWLGSFQHPHTLLGFGLYFLAIIFNIYALQEIELKHITSWLGLSYILVVVLSKYILKEQVNWAKTLGCIIIAIGILIFALPVG